jgi:hypothetical protein
LPEAVEQHHLNIMLAVELGVIVPLGIAKPLAVEHPQRVQLLPPLEITILLLVLVELGVCTIHHLLHHKVLHQVLLWELEFQRLVAEVELVRNKQVLQEVLVVAELVMAHINLDMLELQMKDMLEVMVLGQLFRIDEAVAVEELVQLVKLVQPIQAETEVLELHLQ